MVLRSWISSIALLLTLNGCGGGGGTSTPTVDDTNDTTDTNNTVIDDSAFTDPLYKEFNVGFGGSGSFGFQNATTGSDPVWLSSIDLMMDDAIEDNGYYQEIKNFDASQFDLLQQKLTNSKYVVYWITKYWQENWNNVTEIQAAMDQGYIPVFNYWYFADELGGGLPTEDEITAYHEHNIKVANFLKQLNGTKFVIMEPEFNKNVVTDADTNQHTFSAIISTAIDNIRNNTSGVLFSLCMMDRGARDVNEVLEGCGYDNCALGDKEEWAKPQTVYNDLIDKLDFISFEQMIGQFGRDHSNPGTYSDPIPGAYTNDELGIEQLPQRIANMAKYLREKYNKPVFMPYIAVATATWNDANANGAIEAGEIDKSGWESEAQSVYAGIMALKTQLLANGMFGFAVMALFDDPQHDIDGYQYFLNNEYHLGIIKSSAVDETDEHANGDIVFKQDIVDTVFGN